MTGRGFRRGGGGRGIFDEELWFLKLCKGFGFKRRMILIVSRLNFVCY